MCLLLSYYCLKDSFGTDINLFFLFVFTLSLQVVSFDFSDVIIADFHIHSPYSAATSKAITILNVSHQARNVGLNLVGTGDVFHPLWLKHIKTSLSLYNSGVFKFKNSTSTFFVLAGEVEDLESIHHLILLPDWEAVTNVFDSFNRLSPTSNLNRFGRPRLNSSAEEIAEIVHDNNGLIGPAHAFTPFRSIFRENRYNSLRACFKTQASKVDFVELGLSANSHLADKLKELWSFAFVSNSDTHSVRPGKLGRECNVLLLDELNFDNLRHAFKGKNSQKILLNVGLDPRLGKYYLSFCYKCRRRLRFINIKKPRYDEQFIEYPLNQRAEILANIRNKKARCPACNGLLKLGVNDRIEMLKTTDEKNHSRPPYYNIIPFDELIMFVFGIKSNTSKTFVDIYKLLINKFNSELELLLKVEIEEINKFNKKLGTTIEQIRNQSIEVIEGGGGIYGSLKNSTQHIL